ncbi:hypothetical protein GCM10025876_26460 [Demequina litorisediminis]|uniref:Uncharacterized protein n=1 Tax=Demequina litorisediminis TaxID=1849022 RepID=A0ABQ6II61_9MICO|nr:hypothetical protein GCM10025876_26460 [Demequina litorisediminis]
MTGLPTPAGDAFINQEYQGVNYEVDVDGARAVLEEAGYAWEGDALMNPDGEAVTFTIQVPQGWNDYVTGISLIADSVAALGVEATVATPDVDTWWADRSNGDFQAVLNWTDTGATPYDIYSNIMDGRWLMPVGEAANYNFGRYDNPKATEALNAYATATDDASRATALEEVQQIFVEDVPAIPIGTRPFISEFNTRNYVGWPSDADPYVNADPTQPTTVKILTSLTPASDRRPLRWGRGWHPAPPPAQFKETCVTSDPLLTIDGFSVVYDVEPPVEAVRDVSLELARGEILGLAGESGCGKTTLAYGVQRLLKAPAVITGGSVVFHDASGDDVEINALDEDQMRAFRWDKVSMVFQGAMNALNPVLAIGSQARRRLHDASAAHVEGRAP